MKISLRPKEARLEHPVVPGLVVTVRRLTNAQRLILQEQAITMLASVVKEQAAGEVDPATVPTAKMPDMLASVAATLRYALVAIEGLEDEDGAQIALSPANMDAVIDSLWAKEFIVPDVDSIVIDQKTGAITPVKAPMQFPVWLTRQATRPETFGPKADLDPKELQPQ